MRVRTSVLVAVGATLALVATLVGLAATRHGRDSLPSPFVHPSEQAAMRAAAEDEATRVASEGDARRAAEDALIDEDTLINEDAYIDEVADRQNGGTSGEVTTPAASGDSPGAIPLPPGGVAVAPSQDALPPRVEPAAQAPWQVPYAEDFEGGWGIGGYADWGVPLTVSDFLVGRPVDNSGQQAMEDQSQALPGAVPRTVPAQPQVRETSPGGAALSPPAPGAAVAPDRARDGVPPPAPVQPQPITPAPPPENRVR